MQNIPKTRVGALYASHSFNMHLIISSPLGTPREERRGGGGEEEEGEGFGVWFGSPPAGQVCMCAPVAW
jgi:hypothetical protein